MGDRFPALLSSEARRQLADTLKVTQFDAAGTAPVADIHGTIHFQETDATGASARVNAVFHAAWLPGSDPNGPPSFYFDTATC